MRMHSIILATGAFLIAVGGLFAQQNTVKPIGSVKQLMEVFTVPLSEAIFEVAVEPPKTDAEWAKVRISALALAESGNLLMIGRRARDQRDWMKFSREQIDAAEAVMAAADAKNLDALSKAGDALSETCYACHERYMAAAKP